MFTSTNFHYSCIEDIRRTLSEYIFINDLTKKVLNSLESYSGKVVNVKFKNHLKECFPEFSVRLHDDSRTAKTIVLNHWNETKKAHENFNIQLISKDYHDDVWPRFDLERSINLNGIVFMDNTISKISEQLASGHWEKYFELQSKLYDDYKIIKSMEN